MKRQLQPHQIIAQSLTGPFQKTIWKPFVKAVDTYALIAPGDRIAVCVSGGKDSMLLAKLMQQLQRVRQNDFALEFLTMDPGYDPAHTRQLLDNAALLGIPAQVFETNILRIVNKQAQHPCFLCARMRRGHLYSKAKELGCNKIALGHHFNDVIETTVMGMFYGSQLQAMPPKLHSTSFPGMTLIRPLYCVHEEDIIAWKNYNGLRFLQCACRFTEQRDAAEDGVGQSKRQEMKQLIRTLRETNPNIEKSIFAAIHDVQIDTLAGCKFAGRRYAFTEYYDRLGQGGED